MFSPCFSFRVMGSCCPFRCRSSVVLFVRRCAMQRRAVQLHFNESSHHHPQLSRSSIQNMKIHTRRVSSFPCAPSFQTVRSRTPSPSLVTLGYDFALQPPQFQDINLIHDLALVHGVNHSLGLTNSSSSSRTHCTSTTCSPSSFHTPHTPTLSERLGPFVWLGIPDGRVRWSRRDEGRTPGGGDDLWRKRKMSTWRREEDCMIALESRQGEDVSWKRSWKTTTVCGEGRQRRPRPVAGVAGNRWADVPPRRRHTAGSEWG